MSFLVSILVAFTLGLTGSGVTIEAPVQAPVVAQFAQVDPILAMDAAATLDDYSATKEFTDAASGNAFMVTYVESSPSSDSMHGEFTLESIDLPGTFHHYIYEILHNA